MILSWDCVAWWGSFVLAAAVGRAITGESTLEVSELVVGLPLAAVAAWVRSRGREAVAIAVGIVLVVAGVAIGVLAA